MNPPIRPDISDPNAKPDRGARPDSSGNSVHAEISVKADPNLLAPEPEIVTAEPAALRIANALPPKKTTTTTLTKESVRAIAESKFAGPIAESKFAGPPAEKFTPPAEEINSAPARNNVAPLTPSTARGFIGGPDSSKGIATPSKKTAASFSRATPPPIAEKTSSQPAAEG